MSLRIENVYSVAAAAFASYEHFAECGADVKATQEYSDCTVTVTITPRGFVAADSDKFIEEGDSNE